MHRMKILKTKLLFALDSEENFEYKTYEWLYFRLTEFEPGSVRDAAARLVKAGAVDKIIRGRRAQFRLTANGQDQLLSQMKGLREKKKVWDRIWRVVILTQVGFNSRQLRRELKRLGYQKVERAVYITPFSVSEATKQLFLEPKWQNKAQVIESRRLIVGDNLRLARTLWQLDQQAQKYTDFVSLSDRLLRMARKNLVLLRQAKVGFKAVFDRYFSLIMSDPGLPKQLLPSDWQNEEAKELFKRLVELTKTAKI